MDKEIPVTQQDCYSPRTHLPVEHPQIENAASLFAALADPTRLAILNLLADHQENVCVCDITENFNLGQPTISHHLKMLHAAHLVHRSKRGKWVYYSLQEENAGKVRQLLDTVLATPAVPQTALAMADEVRSSSQFENAAEVEQGSLQESLIGL